jgi:hypothetical protein
MAWNDQVRTKEQLLANIPSLVQQARSAGQFLTGPVDHQNLRDVVETLFGSIPAPAAEPSYGYLGFNNGAFVLPSPPIASGAWWGVTPFSEFVAKGSPYLQSVPGPLGHGLAVGAQGGGTYECTVSGRVQDILGSSGVWDVGFGLNDIDPSGGNFIASLGNGLAAGFINFSFSRVLSLIPSSKVTIKVKNNDALPQIAALNISVVMNRLED